MSGAQGERTATHGHTAYGLTSLEDVVRLSEKKSDTRLMPGEAPTLRVLFLDYLEQSSREVVIRVNPDDLGKDWEKNPVFSWPTGKEVFLWTSRRARTASVEKVAVDRQLIRGRRIEIRLRSETDIPVGWIVLSERALPEQTWKKVAASDADINMARQLAERRIREITVSLKAAKASLVDRATYEFFGCSKVNTRLGDFLVVAFGTPEEGEFVTRHTIVFRSDNGTWVQLYEDSDLGFDVFVDIDGDGVPDTAGATGYNSIALWKIYPKKSLVIMCSSGV